MPPTLRRERLVQHNATLAGVGAVLAGALLVGSALAPGLAPPALVALPLVDPISALEREVDAAAGIAVLFVGRGLLKGDRRAAIAAAVALCLLAELRAALGLRPLGSAIALGLAALLYVNRAAFRRGSEARPRLGPGIAALVAAAGAYAVAAVGLATTAGSLGDASWILAQASAALLGGAWWMPSGSALAVVFDALLAAAVAAGLLFLRGLLRPLEAPVGHTRADHLRAAALVAQHGRDSLAPFALREDKSFHFAAGGFLAYRTLRETAVVSGDPIGPPGSAPLILRSFLEIAAGRGWDVVVTAVAPDDLDRYRALGLRAVRIGEEAVVDPRAFSLEGRAIRKVRQSVSRLVRRGWTIEVVEGSHLAAPVADDIEQVERGWRAARPRIQGFAMTLGRLWGAPEDASSLYVVARDPEGAVCAFLRFAVHARGLSLDVMRRLGDEPNGLNEALVVEALRYAAAQGMEEVSLNFAGFGHLMAPKGMLTPGQRLARRALMLTHGRFQLERLVRFNDKFAPTWRPRYLLYCGLTRLPIAGLRVLQAEAYLRPPRVRPLTPRWEPLPYPVPSEPAAVLR